MSDGDSETPLSILIVAPVLIVVCICGSYFLRRVLGMNAVRRRRRPTVSEVYYVGDSLAHVTPPSLAPKSASPFITPYHVSLPFVDESMKDEECSICIEQFGEESIARIHCGHCFHAACLRKWWHLKPSDPICPICRAPLHNPDATEPIQGPISDRASSCSL